jgi:adenosylcobyric acid synthase
VALRFVGPGETIPPADVIILPGSKSVRHDLAWLRAQGWETAILRHLRYGGRVVGICGGFQMLGRAIHDPLGLEGDAGTTAGLGLLDMETTLEAQKQLRNVRGRLALHDALVSGYEIHHGISHGAALTRPLARLGNRTDGAISEDNRIIGTYLHGLFETTAACDALLDWAGLTAPQTPDYAALREAGIERLADAVETHLDLDRLAGLLRLPARRRAR